MDAKALLEDLYFKLSNTGSGHSADPSQVRLDLNDNVLSDVEDRTKMTEKWVASISLNRRKRCQSFDSYFEVDSVCKRLKKCFLKSCVVREEDLENLRLRLSQLKIEDPEQCNQNLQTCIKDFKAKTKVVLGNQPVVLISEIKGQVSRYRSRTEPLPFEINSWIKSHIIQPSKLFEIPTIDLVDKNLTLNPSVRMMKDNTSTVNSNQVPFKDSIDPEESASTSSSPNTVGIKATCFRQVSLYPSSEELKECKPLLKTLSPNIVVGCYKNAEDYLETQFNLLREDFIAPLMEGIRDYKRQLRDGIIPEDVRNLKLYHHVHVIEPRIRDGLLGIAIDMGFPLSEKIGDKDFMNGALVLVTTNHFKSIYVGTVLSRKFQPRVSEADVLSSLHFKRKKNTLMVQLHGNSHFDAALRHRKVLLAESQAFFQPYFYVMKIFQGMNHEDLPLKDYLIGSPKTTADAAPSYLVKGAEYLLEGTFTVEVENKSAWPQAEDLCVNDSQLRAMKKALTEKLVLIQGPPGTGKTYLGCKVAKALLQNQHFWNKEGNNPMLLMCQTNHALDQFMELLLPITRNIIRIGNQSRSSILEPFNMRERVKRAHAKISSQPDFAQQRNLVKAIAKCIQAFYLESTRLRSYGIIDIDTLVKTGIVDKRYASCFTSSENFLMWLEEARLCEIIHKQRKEESCTASISQLMKCTTHHNNVAFERLQVAKDAWLFEAPDLKSILSLESAFIQYCVNLSDLEDTLSNQQQTDMEARTENTDVTNENEKLQERLRYFRKHTGVTSENRYTYVAGQCPWTVSPCMRWCLYRSWITKLETVLQSHLEILESHYLSSSSTLHELKQKEKLMIMRNADLVGMTTSAAARLYPVLCELRCPIVLVEEAAEVHESHIVATITRHCEHLILLGDHKQLRPRPACFSLSQTHFTDVSLFERLVLNKTVAVSTLLIQHRMQPQISALLRPSIYAELYDHECTMGREKIIGIQRNVFFFSHSWKEKKNFVTGSYSNPFEARMAVQLLRFLLYVKYTANEICILAAYREQVKEIEKEHKLYPELNDIRILTIDNFQGEECRIIILSLVRNNSKNQIGFLKVENRVCVALSRARDGLFILGNMNLLSGNSELWQSIQRNLEEDASVGSSFPLICPLHPYNHFSAFQPDDFYFYIHEGGCLETCNRKLFCGHSCRRHCHKDDALHLYYRCNEPCKRKCAFGHRCYKSCSEICDDCENIVWKHLACGHKALVKCSLGLHKYLCEVVVRKCMEPCSHWMSLQCWMPPLSKKYCPNQCPFLLKCGHQCPLRCNSQRHPSHFEMRCKCDSDSSKHIAPQN